jgi:hypothetical protein
LSPSLKKKEENQNILKITAVSLARSSPIQVDTLACSTSKKLQLLFYVWKIITFADFFHNVDDPECEILPSYLLLLFKLQWLQTTTTVEDVGRNERSYAVGGKVN